MYNSRLTAYWGYDLLEYEIFLVKMSKPLIHSPDMFVAPTTSLPSRVTLSRAVVTGSAVTGLIVVVSCSSICEGAEGSSACPFQFWMKTPKRASPRPSWFTKSWLRSTSSEFSDKDRRMVPYVSVFRIRRLLLTPSTTNLEQSPSLILSRPRIRGRGTEDRRGYWDTHTPSLICVRIPPMRLTRMHLSRVRVGVTRIGVRSWLLTPTAVCSTGTTVTLG